MPDVEALHLWADLKQKRNLGATVASASPLERPLRTRLQKLDKSQESPGNRPQDGQGSDSVRCGEPRLARVRMQVNEQFTGSVAKELSSWTCLKFSIKVLSRMLH